MANKKNLRNLLLTPDMVKNRDTITDEIRANIFEGQNKSVQFAIVYLYRRYDRGYKIVSVDNCPDIAEYNNGWVDDLCIDFYNDKDSAYNAADTLKKIGKYNNIKVIEK